MSGTREEPASAARSRGRLDRSLDAAILQGALDGLAEWGYDRITMEDIAARAHVGKAAIYRRWPSKAVVVAEAIAHWRRGAGPLEAPDTGSLIGDFEALLSRLPDHDVELSTINVIIGVATVAVREPTLAAAIDDLVLAQPRQTLKAMLDRAVKRGEISPARDLTLVPDVLLGLNMLRVVTGRPIDRVFVRRVLQDVILPLVTAPAPEAEAEPGLHRAKRAPNAGSSWPLLQFCVKLTSTELIGSVYAGKARGDRVLSAV
jgi:AcrR family transcriptional regulator